MTKQAPPGPRRSAPLAQRFPADTDATQIAEAMDALWRDIDRTLSPIIGRRGVAALFQRSLQLTLAAHPALAAGRNGIDPAIDPATWKSLLAEQDAADAAVLGNAFAHGFHTLLASLIGPALTERLLRPSWSPPANDPQE